MKQSQPGLTHMNRHYRNEEGFLLVASILILLVLSLMAIAMSNTSVTEIMIAGNERVAQEEFFIADAGINTILAQTDKPLDSYRPPPGTYALVPFSCNAPQHSAYAHYDLDGVAGDDVDIYLVEFFKPPSGPLESKIASCATRGNTTVQIIAGIEYVGTAQGGGTGGPGEIKK